VPDSSVAITAGTGTLIDTVTTPAGEHRQVVFSGNRGGHPGHTSTFRTPGRAGTTGQNLFSIHNATGSTIALDVRKIVVGFNATVAKAVTVMPPVIRCYKVTVLPTLGTPATKVTSDSAAMASSASVTIREDASADGTSSASALTATIPAGAVIDQAFAPRVISAAGVEFPGRIIFLEEAERGVILRPLEGIVVRLDYTLATQNPITDMWTVSACWEEFTP